MVSELAIDRSGGRSVVSRLRATAPLRVLTPRNHGPGAWCFTSHLGGGFVDGDRIALDVEMAAGAMALVGTQASTKVYRSPRGTSQRLGARVGDGALLALIPDPVACFAGARYEQRVEVDLGATAELALVDAYTCGRTAHGERWEMSRFVSTTRVRRQGRLLVHDATELDAAHGDLRRRMGRFETFATVVLAGELATIDPPARETGPELLRQHARLAADLVVTRFAATKTEVIATAIREHLGTLASRLGDDPFARKW